MGVIKFAIIGAGHIGKRHADMIQKNPSAKLMSICDVNPNIYDDLKDLIRFLGKNPDNAPQTFRFLKDAGMLDEAN